MAKLDNPVLLGVVGAPHGVRGEVRVKSFTADPEALGDYGPLATADGRALAVAAIRPSKTVVIVRFEGVATREAAEALNGVELFVDRSVLPPEEDEDEFYHADLIGLSVVDQAGSTVGRVTAVHDFGAGDILEIARPTGRSVMAPFTRAAVPEIDLAAGRIVVDRISAGLDGAAGGDEE